MTIIVVRDGVMAADRGMIKGEIVYGYRDKIIRLVDGSLYAGAGRNQDVLAVQAWLDGASEKPTQLDKSFRGIVLQADGAVYEIEAELVLEYYDQPYCYVGSEHAECFAHGALAMGATAEQAVRLTVDHCVYANGDVQVESIL